MESIALNFSQVTFKKFFRGDTNAGRPVRGGYDFTTVEQI